MHSTWVAFGSAFGLLAVALGAFAAHGLKPKLTAEQLGVFQTGAQYQMYHALALVGLGIWSKLQPKAHLLPVSGWLLVIGMVLFSGSLYALTLTKIKALGAITPFGGLALMAGWLLLFLSALGVA